MSVNKTYDIIVIGAGHAGCEAALASSRMGLDTLLITMDKERIALMSCNPAIGGVGKGQLVKELDALGGEMAKATDRTGIQFRTLNSSKGPAVRSSRAQVDRKLYSLYMKAILERTENLKLIESQVLKILIERDTAIGVEILDGIKIFSKAVILTPGTFLNGLIHIGMSHFPGGRIGDFPAFGLSENLKSLGFSLGRLKTGTTPRLDARTIDFSKLIEQRGDEPPQGFSFSTEKLEVKQLSCFITFTNPKTHELIRSSLDRSPLYTGKIKSTGVRYCPSIEDKVVRFSQKDRHQLFLEPDGRETYEYYPNGISTSLPVDIQIEMLHSIEGLENVEIIRPGYAIEYDFVYPTQLLPTLETKIIRRLFFAGQINGTTGYEEAAAQGLIAGINAALELNYKEPLILDRTSSYIGVLIDDLVTKGTEEPYRMFTSRVEYRLLLREDNADIRLRELGFGLGLVSEGEFKKTRQKYESINLEIRRLRSLKVNPTEEINNRLKNLNSSPIKNSISFFQLLKRPQINFKLLKDFDGGGRPLTEDGALGVEIEIKYKGFIDRQIKEVENFKRIERIKLPPDIDYYQISGLSNEVKEKLSKFRPLNLGQASRISGVTPVAISILMVYLKSGKFKNKAQICCGLKKIL